MEKTYGLYNSNGEIVSDVHSVSAENQLEALVAMCLRHNHDLSDEQTDKVDQEQVTKPSLADVKKKVAEKKSSTDHTDKKTKLNGR